jgi:type II secretory pathway component PulC
LRYFYTLRPFLFITFLCVAGVLFFYQLVEHVWLRPLVVTTASSRTSGPTAGGEDTNKYSNYQIILRRNLFGTGPVSSEIEDTQSDSLADLAITAPDMLLLGTVTGDKEEMRAIIMNTATQKQHLVHIGDSLNGAFVKDIQREKVVLHTKGRDEVLDMTETRQYFSDKKNRALAQRQERPLSLLEQGQQALRAAPVLKIVPPVGRFSVEADSEGTERRDK